MELCYVRVIQRADLTKLTSTSIFTSTDHRNINIKYPYQTSNIIGIVTILKCSSLVKNSRMKAILKDFALTLTFDLETWFKSTSYNSPCCEPDLAYGRENIKPAMILYRDIQRP